MTISSSGPISISNIATEYDLSLNELDFDRLSKIARLPASRDIGSFRGTSSNNFTGNAGYYQRVTGVSSANSAALSSALGAAAVRALVNMSDATTGVIFEGGGTGTGFALYVHSGTIYAQYGDGDVVGGDYEVSYTVPSTWTTDDTHEIVVSCDSRGYGLARMYIDGILVSTEYNATPNKSKVGGSGAAGSGQVYSNMPYTRMNPTNGSSDGALPFTGGTIRSVSTYSEVTAVPFVDSSVFGSSTYTSGVASATNILSEQSTCTILTNVTIDKDRTGVIYESGADGSGVALYVHGGKLYIEGGAGGVVGGNVSTNWTIPDYFSTNDRTEIIASVEIISTGSSAKLFVNNREVTSNTAAGSGNEISGSDQAGTGEVHDALRFTQLNPTDASSDGSLQYTGTIYDTQVYSGMLHGYADGGTITYATIGSNTYRIHAFTYQVFGPSHTFFVTSQVECDVLLVAGGGGGGGSGGSGASGAGGGAGGLILDLNKTVSPGSYSIVVGANSQSINPGFDLQGPDGGDTSAFSLTAVGGGGGGSRVDGNANGRDGGSGGGEGSQGVTTSYGSGTSGQGNRGGLNGFSGDGGDPNASGGGGGAGGVGGDGLDDNYSGDGGAGLDMSAYFTTSFGDNGYFAGGGGGGRPGSVTNGFGSGGIGGGADGGNNDAPESGMPGTGGGGAGAGSNNRAGPGGSGIVLIRYRV